MSWVFPTALFSPDPILYIHFILRAVTIWTVAYWWSQSIMTRTNQHPCRSTGKRENCIFESGTNTWRLIQQLQDPNETTLFAEQILTSTERGILFLFSPTSQTYSSIWFSKTLTQFSGCLLHPLLFLGCPNGAPLLLLFSPCVTAGWSLTQQISLCRW